MVRPRRCFILLIALFALATFACRGGNSRSADVTPTEVPTPADAAAVRDVDFGSVAPFQTLLRQTGGQFDPRAIAYADLTGDGREEAIVPVASGGTLGNVAYQVYTLRGGAPALILTSTRDQGTPGGLVMSVQDGKLVRSVGKYGPDDPRCCPSSFVKTYYRWDGTNLQVQREQEESAGPAPKTKD